MNYLLVYIDAKYFYLGAFVQEPANIEIANEMSVIGSIITFSDRQKLGFSLELFPPFLSRSEPGIFVQSRKFCDSSEVLIQNPGQVNDRFF